MLEFLQKCKKKKKIYKYWCIKHPQIILNTLLEILNTLLPLFLLLLLLRPFFFSAHSFFVRLLFVLLKHPAVSYFIFFVLCAFFVCGHYPSTCKMIFEKVESKTNFLTMWTMARKITFFNFNWFFVFCFLLGFFFISIYLYWG